MKIATPKIILLLIGLLAFGQIFAAKNPKKPVVAKPIVTEQKTEMTVKETSKIDRNESNSNLIMAEIARQEMKFALAAEYYEAYLTEAGSSPEKVLTELANCYWQMRAHNLALRTYQRLFPNGKEGAETKEQLRIGELYARKGEYQQAAQWINGIPGYEAKANGYQKREIIDSLKSDSSVWKINFMNINTPYREFAPIVCKEYLFFSSTQPLLQNNKANAWDGDGFSHLWQIALDKSQSLANQGVQDSSFYRKQSDPIQSEQLAGIYECGDAKSSNSVLSLLMRKPTLKKGTNTTASLVKGLDKLSANSATAALDLNRRIYFSSNIASKDNKSLNRICIMEGSYTTDGVKDAQELPFCSDNSFSVMHPAVNREGTILVCTSDKKGGKGAFDLYYAQRKAKSKTWSKLKAFGNNVNTAGNEVFPNITPNGFLYFSSDALQGIGGLDIFRIPLEAAINGNGVTENIGYPINSAADDFGWTQKDSIGTKGFFSSDRLNNNDNIFSFENGMATGYVKPEDRLKLGFTWKLKNVHYDFDKSDLRTDAKPILDSLVKISKDHLITLDSLMTVLNKNPITIEISSHTDSRGSYKYNMELAQRRAEAVVAYLIEHGIDPKRMTARSYGKENLLKEEEKTDEDFQVNRRSEVKITGMGDDIKIDSLQK